MKRAFISLGLPAILNPDRFQQPASPTRRLLNNTVATLLVLGLAYPTLTTADEASAEEIRSAWLAFSNARGEPSLIRGDIDHATANAVFRVIPDVTANTLDEEKLQLGFDLFNERRLSRDGSVACSTCHVGLLSGTDRQPVSFGIDRARGTLNAPTIFNAALNFRQFWDGRSLTLQDQALEPIKSATEFGHDLDGAVAVLQGIPEYVDTFQRLYPDGVTAANLGNAIAYYETMNFTGISSPFLRQFDEGQSALSRRARRGQQRFVEVGCASCHNGVNLGGNSYQELGVATSWFGPDRPADEADQGLLGRTGREQDRHVFKVPSLHNVANTGPWFHDGSVTSLQQAVDQMARYQSGRYLESHDIDDIVAFLRSMGDSLGMIGDCAVGGNYGVTMDCSVKRRTASGDQTNKVAPATLPDAATLAQKHAEEYAAALQLTRTAPQRIKNEIARIRSGEVAHYDFLQFEHFEMLRHARALSVPPANLDAEQRAQRLTLASQWQQTAQQYELVIADFLRAHAVALSAKMNYQDLLRAFSLDADEKTRSMLARAEQSLLDYYRQPGADTQAELEKATRTLQELDLNMRQLEELKLQEQMLVENLTDTDKQVVLQ